MADYWHMWYNALMDWTEIIIAIIPAVVTLLTTFSVKRQANKHSCRQSILQLILEDKIAVSEGKLPNNYPLILDEYDEYTKAGGNSYIHEKVDEYKKWYKSIEERKTNARKRRSTTTSDPDKK